MSRKYKSLPVHIVEYHHEALEHMYRAIGSKHLPVEGNVLLHFDAHPDMMIPDICADVVFDKEKLFDSLSIENWITPALYAGHFDTVLWFKADWAEQIKNGDYEFAIGKHSDSGKIRVTCVDNYFVSECLFAQKIELLGSKDVKFLVRTCKTSHSVTKEDDFCAAFSGKPYVLDIDLDFFSTKNPIKELLPKREYDRLKSVYEFAPPESRDENKLKICCENRETLLNQLKTILLDIENGDFSKWEGNHTFAILKSIYDNLKNSSIANEVDAELLHDFGCTTDDPELPHHVSSEAEIDSLIVGMKTIVKSLKYSPTLVTVSRSSVDEYCPPSQVGEIENKVVECLKNVFGDVKVFKHYLE